jgi:hypothetical protein
VVTKVSYDPVRIDISSGSGGRSAVRLTVQNRLERGAFRMAVYRDVRRELKADKISIAPRVTSGRSGPGFRWP